MLSLRIDGFWSDDLTAAKGTEQPIRSGSFPIALLVNINNLNVSFGLRQVGWKSGCDGGSA